MTLRLAAMRAASPDQTNGLLREALERLSRNFDLLLAGKPVRDVAETKAEVRAALASTPTARIEEGAPEADLVRRFGEALLTKLLASEEKYGWNRSWLRDDWQGDLATNLLKHIAKGDPIDVAAYCAFAWHHGWPVSARIEESER